MSSETKSRAGAEALAKAFHEAYERLAPRFGYETRKDSAVPWEQVPERNKNLMIAICTELESSSSADTGGREALREAREYTANLRKLASEAEDPELSDYMQIIEVFFDRIERAGTTGAEGLTFAGFSRVNRERCESKDGFNHALNSWSTSDWFLALFGELGEAANVAKKLNRYRDGIPGNKQSKEELEAMLRAELGDSYVYLDLLAQSLNVAIGEAASEVFDAKSKQLGCPIRMDAAKQRAPVTTPGRDWRTLLANVVEGVEPFQSGRDGDDCCWCRRTRDRKIDSWQASQKSEYHDENCEFAIAAEALAAAKEPRG